MQMRDLPNKKVVGASHPSAYPRANLPMVPSTHLSIPAHFRYQKTPAAYIPGHYGALTGASHFPHTGGCHRRGSDQSHAQIQQGIPGPAIAGSAARRALVRPTPRVPDCSIPVEHRVKADEDHGTIQPAFVAGRSPTYGYFRGRDERRHAVPTAGQQSPHRHVTGGDHNLAAQVGTVATRPRKTRSTTFKRPLFRFTNCPLPHSVLQHAFSKQLFKEEFIGNSPAACKNGKPFSGSPGWPATIIIHTRAHLRNSTCSFSDNDSAHSLLCQENTTVNHNPLSSSMRPPAATTTVVSPQQQQ